VYCIGTSQNQSRIRKDLSFCGPKQEDETNKYYNPYTFTLGGLVHATKFFKSMPLWKKWAIQNLAERVGCPPIHVTKPFGIGKQSRPEGIEVATSILICDSIHVHKPIAKL
jgi:hypothetical protein